MTDSTLEALRNSLKSLAAHNHTISGMWAYSKTLKIIIQEEKRRKEVEDENAMDKKPLIWGVD